MNPLHNIPAVLIARIDKQLVTKNSCIVNQYVDPTEYIDCSLYNFLSIFNWVVVSYTAFPPK